MIGLLKPCLEQAIAGKRYSYGELATVMAEAAQVVNSRPIARGSDDTQAGGPITPLHLQLGRATVEVPRVRFEETPSLTRQLQHAEEGVKQFWKKWMQIKPREGVKPETVERTSGGKEWNPGSGGSGQEDRPRREATQKAMDALKKGADATRGRGRRKGRMYQRAGIRN
jgi:hypothetical protein